MLCSLVHLSTLIHIVAGREVGIEDRDQGTIPVYVILDRDQIPTKSIPMGIKWPHPHPLIGEFPVGN